MSEPCQNCRLSCLPERVSKLEVHTERTYNWLEDVAKDVKGVTCEIQGVKSELSKIREDISGFKGKMNVIVWSIATLSAAVIAAVVQGIVK